MTRFIDILQKDGWIFGVLAAIVSVLVSDMHTVSDLIIQGAIAQDALIPLEICFPYQVSGYIGQPLLGVFVIGFGLTWYLLFVKNKKKLVWFASITLIIWGITGFVAAIADILYADAIVSFINDFDSSVLIIPGYIRGISALVIGLLGGVVFTTLALIHFGQNKNNLGITGSVIMIISVIIGIPLKAFSSSHNPALLMGVFLGMMVCKSIGLSLIAIAVGREMDA